VSLTLGDIWGFDKWGYTNSRMVNHGKYIYKWMIWRYPHFRKPPFGNARKYM
jgi:hypothetical protein